MNTVTRGVGRKYCNLWWSRPQVSGDTYEYCKWLCWPYVPYPAVLVPISGWPRSFFEGSGVQQRDSVCLSSSQHVYIHLNVYSRAAQETININSVGRSWALGNIRFGTPLLRPYMSIGYRHFGATVSDLRSGQTRTRSHLVVRGKSITRHSALTIVTADD